MSASDTSQKTTPPQRVGARSHPPRRAAAPAARNPLPPIVFPEALPVSGRRDEIAQAIANHQVVIVSGETGSGKTTQLPKICLTLGRGQAGRIGHTQPRRLAATATARRIAQELNTPLGENVGFKIRFNDKISPGASIKLMTDGILLTETQSDPLLRQYDTLIIDEAHERSLNIDFLLGYLKQLLPRRPDLKLIITSATIDADRFAKHFGSEDKPAPIIEVSGRLYPVEVRYRPIEPMQVKEGASSATPSFAQRQREQRDLIDGIVDAVDELAAVGQGDVLVFLPGEREIREAAEALRKRHPPHVEILPLYARLSAQEQERIFQSTNARRIVLATNVAETSLTVPGIRFVVDTGIARVKRYSYRNKVEQLQIEPISQASANQRAGRCGRVAAGVCIRLYEEQDYLQRDKFTDPEILRSSLASVILRMKSLRLTDVETFPFVEPPLGRAIADGYQLLQELGALDDSNTLTVIGKQLAQLPLDPRVARMILAGKDNACLTEMLIIASALSVQDPRDRPLEAQDAADNAHKKFTEPRSEFLSYLKMWQWFETAVEHKKSNRKLQESCRDNFLSHLRLREWRDVHAQLLTIVKEQGWRLNESPATYEQIHIALLTGLLGNIGFKAEDEPHYLGARGIRFFIWPGSTLGKKAGRWVMAAELVDTTRLYARCLAQIQPEWLERVGGHLLKKSYGEPRWEKRSAQVSAYERATLYGLVVYSQRRVDYARINPEHAREIFIRDALVGGDLDTRAPFFGYNQKLVRDIEKLEHKSRRTDVLVDDDLIAAFYDKMLPPDVCNGITFEKWHKEATFKNARLLFLNKEDLMRHEAAGITTDLFPKKLAAAGIDMGLTYHFEPGSPRDGVTLAVPLYALNQVSSERGDWLVPGMLKEKVHLLLKSLPQKLRRHCVPLPHYAAAFCERMQGHYGESDLIETLIADLREQLNLVAKPADFKLETLPAHHFMNYKVIDEHGRQLDMGRNLVALRAELGGEARESFQRLADKATLQAAFGDPIEATQAGGQPQAPIGKASASTARGDLDNITAWTFGELPELLEITKGKQTLVGFPALVDKTDHCELEVYDDPDVAERTHRSGLRRLFALQLKDQVKALTKNIGNLQQMGMQYMQLGTQEELRDHIMDAALEIAAMQDPMPKNAEQFDARKEDARKRLGLLVNQVSQLAAQILAEYHALPRKLQGFKAHKQAVDDIQSQVQGLIGKRFLLDNDYAQLAHFPRYLKAINVRLDKLRADPTRDARLLSEWQGMAALYQRALKDRSKSADPKMKEFRWMLEELRVSLFAQELRTPMPVSVKRLQKVWESMQR